MLLGSTTSKVSFHYANLGMMHEKMFRPWLLHMTCHGTCISLQIDLTETTLTTAWAVLTKHFFQIYIGAVSCSSVISV